MKITKNIKLILVSHDKLRIDESEFRGPDLSAKELIDLLKNQTNEEYDISIRALRWYASEGLITKPTRKGKFAYYSHQSFWDIYSILLLQNQYSVSIAKMKEIKISGVLLYEVLIALIRLENKYYRLQLFPTISNHVRELNRGLTEMEDPMKIIILRSTSGEAKEMMKEMDQLPFTIFENLGKDMKEIKKELFLLLKKKVNPWRIDLEMI